MKHLVTRAFSALVILSLFSVLAKGQCTISSKDGYDVNISITATSVKIQNGSCDDNWYNYNIVYKYDISFTGENTPKSLWTLQGRLGCEDGSHFIPLPNEGGSGEMTSGSNVTRRNSDCKTATPASLGCEKFVITINGPGISTQEVECKIEALPVDLISFDAEKVGDMVVLEWSTAMELNNDYFTVEKSTDGENFEDIIEVVGSGNSNDVLHYSATDFETLSTPVYYRLRQTDFDGTTSYSSVVLVKSNELQEKITVYPNPNIDSEVKVDLGLNAGANTIVVKGIDGQILQTKVATTQIVSLDELPRGVYFIQIENHSKSNLKTIKFIQK